MPPPTQDIRIIARPQVHPLKCDFEVDRPVIQGAAWFGTPESAAGSPLPEKLFALEGVAGIMLRDARLTVTRTAQVEWQVLAPRVGATVRAHLQSGLPALKEGYAATGPQDELIREKVQRILDEEINPAVAMHGGFIQILDVQQGVVYVKMGGGCHGCASSTATLKHGVEQAVRAKVPEVVDILDTTDHASGSNPYYSPY